MKLIPAVLLSVVMSAVHAEATKDFPAELTYAGKPIDPLCFFSMEGNSNTIDLTHCGIEKDKYKKIGENAELIKKGFIGFDWKESEFSSQGYSYYKFFPAGNNQYWIYTLNNGGGSGDFTEINLVSRKNPTTLELKSIAGGDRCNGGVQDVSVQNQLLIYSANVSAYDFLDLAKDYNQHELKAYEDLAECAVCCVGKAFYQVDSKGASQYQYIDLGKDVKVKELPDQGKYQGCFNKLLVSYAAKNPKMNEETLAKFVKEFNSTCVK
jgi:hypothetical protein